MIPFLVPAEDALGGFLDPHRMRTLVLILAEHPFYVKFLTDPCHLNFRSGLFAIESWTLATGSFAFFVQSF
jgi:hypothetical protein